MKHLHAGLTVFIFLFLFSACASYYKTIDPVRVNYTGHDLHDGVNLSYKYDVLNESGNKKYAFKERRNKLRLLAVELTNLTDSTINVGRDLQFSTDDRLLDPINPTEILKGLKQNELNYLPYILLTFTTLTVTFEYESGTSKSTYPIGYLLGPGVTLGNMITAWNANKEFLRELNRYNIINANIPPGETIYGLIGFRNLEYAHISIKLKNN